MNPLLGRCLAETGADVPVVNKIGSGLVEGPDLGRRAVDEYHQGLADLGRSEVVLVHRAGAAWLKRDVALHESVRRSGRSALFGICTNDPAVLELYSEHLRVDVLQAAVNLLDFAAARPVLEAARRRAITIMARSALSSGLLGGAYGPEDGDRFTDSLRRRYGESDRNRRIYGERMERVARIREYHAGLRGRGLFRGSLAAFCYAAVRQLPFVDTVLLGGSTEEQLAENLALRELRLPESVAEDIARFRVTEWSAPYL